MPQSRWRNNPNRERMRVFDPYAHAMTTIDENHRLIHDGFFFELWRGDTSLADAANLDLMLVVPAGTYPHLQDVSLESDGGVVTLAMYEGTTVSANGTSLPVFNKNRNSSNTNNTTLYYAPTITDVGTQFKHAAIVSDSQSSEIFSQSKAGEWVLAPATNYLIRVNNASGAARNINLQIGFYELDYQDD